MRKRNVIILSHHLLFLHGLTTIIDNSKYYTVTACCRAEADFIAAMSKTWSDIAILDCSCLSSRALLFRVVRKVAEVHPDLKLMIVGEDPWHKILATSFLAEYVCKSQGAPQLLMALARADTSPYRVCDFIHAERADDNAVVTLENYISKKESQVIRLIHSGLTVSEVAEKVKRSVKTISTQKRSAMKKLGLKHDKDLYTLDL